MSHSLKLHQVLQQALVGQDLKSMARAMDCLPERINHVVVDPWLGLDHRRTETLQTDARKFVTLLAKKLALDPSITEWELRNLERLEALERGTFKRQIVVHTNFRRTTQPIFALAALSHLRYISLSEELNRLSAEACILEVGSIIRAHYQECEGRLAIFGPIDHYELIISKERTVVFNANGEQITQHAQNSEFKVTVSLKGQNIGRILSGGCL